MVSNDRVVMAVLFLVVIGIFVFVSFNSPSGESGQVVSERSFSNAQDSGSAVGKGVIYFTPVGGTKNE